MSAALNSRPLFDPPIVRRAVIDAFKKLDPRRQVRNPVMFTVFVGSVLTTGLGVHTLVAGGQESPGFVFGISAWLWFTVLFANFAEAMAEGRGKAQADALRAARENVPALKCLDKIANLSLKPDVQDLLKNGEATIVPAPDLREGDIVM